jgi:hypothetical protein
MLQNTRKRRDENVISQKYTQNKHTAGKKETDQQKLK